jgi:phosphatidylglycerol:prolipoprotein diacylglycerol transferase
LIPYFSPGPITIAGIDFYWFMILIVVGIAAGTEYARARAIRENLSVKITVDCTLFMVLMGFLVAHLVSVVFYHPDRLAEDWKKILPWYDFSISSMGGYLGAAVAIPLFLKVWKKVPVWAYTDCLSFGVTLGFVFGRIGCFSAHDHKGAVTDFFLAVDFPRRVFPQSFDGVPGPRHDLGLYEALFLAGVFTLFVVLDRKREWFHGFFTGLLLTLYGPARLFFDALRATDLPHNDRRFRPGDLFATAQDWVSQGGEIAVANLNIRQAERISSEAWAGLTFAQYGSIAIFGFGLWILYSRHDKGRMDTSAELARDLRPPKSEASAPVGVGSDEEQGDPQEGGPEA